MTGPYKINGVPLKRVNQAYTMTTSTVVDVKGADVSKIDDAMFTRSRSQKKADSAAFFAEGAKVRILFI